MRVLLEFHVQVFNLVDRVHANVRLYMYSIHTAHMKITCIPYPTFTTRDADIYTYPRGKVSVEDTSGVKVGHTRCNIKCYLYTNRP